MTETPSFDIRKFAKRLFNTSLTVSLLGAVGIGFLMFSMCFSYVRPYEYGIKEVQIGIGKQRGIQEKVYTSGLFFVMPFGFERMHRFPKNIQLLNLTDSQNDRSQYRQKAAHIQTSDGFFVDVDVSILYRIVDPLMVIKTIGVGDLYISDGILPRAEPILKETLGQLTTEEFYNPHLRVEKMALAQSRMDEELRIKGIAVDQVLVRFFRYSTEIQKNIEEKKLKDQLVFKNQAEAKSAMEAATLAKIIEEGEAKLKIELEKGRAYVVRKNAERDLYVRKQRAAGDLLVKKSEAKRTKLKNLALRGSGSENLVALKMAEVLEGLDVIVLPSDGANGFNPLNLDSIVEYLD